MFYPAPTEGLFDEEDQEHLSFKEYELLLNSNVTEENRPDTLFFKYDARGLLLNTEKDDAIYSASEVKKLYQHPGDFSDYLFHQCYVGNIKMESFILKKLGYLPELLLIEIFKYGVFSFSLNSKTRKYYRSKEVMLVQ